MADRPRVLPHNTEAEASMLGGVILHNDRLSLLASVDVDDFYDHRHKVVFTAMRNLEAGGRPIDVVTLEAEIEKTGKLDAVGGIAYLGELCLRVPTADNVEAYAKIVTDHRVSRNVMLLLSDLLEDGYSGELAGEQYVHDVTSAMMHVRTAGDVPMVELGVGSRSEGAALHADLESRARGELAYSGVPTGFTVVDEKIGGDPIGIMTLVIGRPGHGKTTHAMAIAKSSVALSGEVTATASFEDGIPSFSQRAIAQESDVHTERIRARKLDPDERHRLATGLAYASERKELMLEAAGMTVEQLIRRVRREQLRRKMEGKSPIRRLIVDYIQKMPMPEWARSREEGVGHISRALSTFAATDKIAVVAYSQLNREVEKRDDHRPRVSDIRDSGSLEQDAKVIYGLYHPHKYDQKVSPSSLHLLVLKNAQGESMGEIDLYWDVFHHALYNSAIEHQRAKAERSRR